MPLHMLRISRRMEVRLIREYLQVNEQDRVCDIGCGDGYWTTRIARGRFAAGIDIDKAALREARRTRQREGLTYLESSACAMPFADGSFTKMFAVCVMEHIDDDQAALGEMSRVLRPGGVLALTVDSLTHPDTTEEHRRRHHEKYYTPHLYNLDTLSSRLDKAGFDLTDHAYIISTDFSHGCYRLIDRHPRSQYVLFPVAYPLMLWWEKTRGGRHHGWKLGVRAVKR